MIQKRLWELFFSIFCVILSAALFRFHNLSLNHSEPRQDTLPRQYNLLQSLIFNYKPVKNYNLPKIVNMTKSFLKISKVIF